MQFRSSAWLAAVVVVALAAPSMAQQANPKGPRGTPVVVDAVRTESLSQTIPVLGRFVARQGGVVAARTRGAIAALSVQVGDRVKRGDILAVLEAERLIATVEARKASVATAKAEIKTAQARAALGRQELARLQRLRKSAAFSQARYDDKRSEIVANDSEVAEARAELRRAEAELELAQIDLANANVKAPYDGAVIETHTEAGAFVNEGASVATLVNDQDLEIEADVPITRIGGIAPRAVVEAELQGGERLKAEVRATIPQDNSLTRTRAVRFTPSFDIGERRLAVNTSVTMHLPIGGARDIVSVHKDAIIRRGNTSVFKVVDGKAVPTPVQLGDAVGGRFEVLGGLSSGDLVVVRGNERLRPGQDVTYEPPGNTAAKPGDSKS